MNTMKQMNKLMQSAEKDLKQAPTSYSMITCNKTKQDVTDRQHTCSDSTFVLGIKASAPEFQLL